MNRQPVLLYVEDDPESREIMRLLVCEVMGIEALTIFEDSQNFQGRVQALDALPDLVMLDIHVPPFNGFQMLKLLRQLPGYEAVPVIALTASVMNEEVEQLQHAGFDGVIAKPVDMDTFPQALQHILDGKRVWHVIG